MDEPHVVHVADGGGHLAEDLPGPRLGVFSWGGEGLCQGDIEILLHKYIFQKFCVLWEKGI